MDWLILKMIGQCDVKHIMILPIYIYIHYYWFVLREWSFIVILKVKPDMRDRMRSSFHAEHIIDSMFIEDLVMWRHVTLVAWYQKLSLVKIKGKMYKSLIKTTMSVLKVSPYIITLSCQICCDNSANVCLDLHDCRYSMYKAMQS